MDFALMATIQAIVLAIPGFALILVPRRWVAPFGMRMHADGEWFGRVLGATILGFAVMSWLSRETTDGIAQQAIAVGSVIPNGAAAVLHVPRVAGAEVLNVRGWGQVVLLGALAVGWIVVLAT